MDDDFYAQERRAWEVMQAGDYLESARLYEPLAALGSQLALNNLGWMHWHGHLGRADQAQAIALWEKSASAGNAWAKCELDEQRAWTLLDNCKYRESARIYESLAEDGSATALLNLGWMYAHGHLGPPALEKAIAFYERVVGARSMEAKRHLGWTWKKKGDYERARAIYLEGAELGSMPCMWRVGRMMVRGEGGAVDHDTGAAWILRSAGSGKLFTPDAQWRLEMGSSPSLAKRLSFFFWQALLLGLRNLGRDCRDPRN